MAREPPRILVVDDHPVTLRTVAHHLGRRYACEFAATLAEARVALGQGSFALVLCDIYLPDGSGLALAEEILQGKSHTAVVLMTVEDDPEIAGPALDLGIHGYLVKPFERGQLLITVMNGLKRLGLDHAGRARMRALEDRLQSVIELAPVPIYAKDRSLRYIVANRSAEDLAKRAPGELLGLTDRAIMSADSAARTQLLDRLVLERGEAHEGQETLWVAGQERTFMTVRFPLFDDSGEVYAVCGVSPEITASRVADQLRDELAEVQAKAISDLRRSRLETVQRLARALELSDESLGRHVDRMARVVAFLGRRLGLDEEWIELLEAAAVMHDVGKMGLPREILTKRGTLSPGERATMQQHTVIGYELLSGSDSELLKLAATIALTHHERFDGTGYPRGLSGEEIPLEGRIAAIADVFDAMLSDRPYRQALPVSDVEDRIRNGRGTQFDPQLVDLLLDHLGAVLLLRGKS